MTSLPAGRDDPPDNPADGMRDDPADDLPAGVGPPAGAREGAMPLPAEPSIDLSGSWRAAIADDALRRDYPDAGFDDGGWERIAVPSHWRSAPAFAGADGPLLYRTTFETPADPIGAGQAFGVTERRTWLVAEGIFYSADVWIDGTYLGDTEGYFFPHAFEVTGPLADRSEHALAMEVTCSPQQDLTAKRNLTGVFQHWDLLDQDWNPGGIWRPVRLVQSGPVRIKHLRVLCREAASGSATVFIRAVLEAKEACTVNLATCALQSPADPSSPHQAVGSNNEQHLAAGENRVEWTHTIEQPRLWWPRSLGDQPLYDIDVAVSTRDGRISDRQLRRIGLRTVKVDDWKFSVNGERLFLKGSNQGPTRMALAEATDDELRNDIELARDAGLDFLRVHAHVSRQALYDAADEFGMLLWQDLPLQWGYSRSVRKQARRQAREAVDLLGHHPSVFVWCGHNEPFAIDVSPDAMTDPKRAGRLIAKFALSTMLPTWNKTVLDYSIKRVLDGCDGSRPVVPHSGVFPHPPLLDGTDTHTYFGWYHGRFRQFATFLACWPRVARFVTEFGAQAVPADAPWLDPDRWPDLDWDRAHRRHALQKLIFDRNVPPAEFPTFESWVEATQRHQADVIRFHIETLRRLKYRPTGGFAQFCFADGFPSVTWSVLDVHRRPKSGFDALRDACRPVIAVADWFHENLRPGDRTTHDIHVVNDLHVDLTNLVLTATLSPGPADGSDDHPGNTPPDTSAAPVGDGVNDSLTWRWEGDAPADSVVRVGTVTSIVPPNGALTLNLVLDGPQLDHPVTNTYHASVADPRRG